MHDDATKQSLNAANLMPQNQENAAVEAHYSNQLAAKIQGVVPVGAKNRQVQVHKGPQTPQKPQC